MARYKDYDVVRGRNVQQVNCDHPECIELRRIRTEAFRLGLMGIVNQAEIELGRRCSMQAKKTQPPREA